MSRFIKILLAVIVVAVGLQWYAPQYVASRAATAIAKVDGGVTPHVELTALPFWMLLQGKFQQAHLNVHGVSVEGMRIDTATLNWDNGQISVDALSHDKLDIVKAGQMTGTVVLGARALSAFLERQGAVTNPVVTMAAGVMTIKGQFVLGGVNLPLDAQGTLSIASGKQAIILHPTSVDGIDLPVLTNMEIFQVSSLHLPVTLQIDSIHMANNQLVIKAGTP